ncbi:CDGSH iron-sulfur domain-containing protein [Methanolobus sediminis]
MALCRCGKSKNKPFCDGTNIEQSLKTGSTESCFLSGNFL